MGLWPIATIPSGNQTQSTIDNSHIYGDDCVNGTINSYRNNNNNIYKSYYLWGFSSFQNYYININAYLMGMFRSHAWLRKVECRDGPANVREVHVLNLTIVKPGYGPWPWILRQWLVMDMLKMLRIIVIAIIVTTTTIICRFPWMGPKMYGLCGKPYQKWMIWG